MPKSEWQALLRNGGIRDLSESDAVRQLTEALLSERGSGTPELTSANGGSIGTRDSLMSQGTSREIGQQMSALAAQVSNLTSTQQTQISATEANTQAVTQNTTSKGNGTSAAGQIGGIAESLFGGALSLTPILSGLASLFGGGSSASNTSTVPFLLPPPVEYQSGLTGTSGGQVAPVSDAQGGQPSPNAPAPQVTVQVNAMDSQSFLDHSDEIAQAVKQALLNSNSLGDVIAEL